MSDVALTGALRNGPMNEEPELPGVGPLVGVLLPEEPPLLGFPPELVLPPELEFPPLCFPPVPPPEPELEFDDPEPP